MNSRSLILIALFGCLNYIDVYSQNNNSNQITVVGTAVVRQKADEVSFTLSIMGTGPSLSAAVDTARRKATDILNVLKQFGYGDDDLTTSHFSEGENPEKLLFSSKKDYRAIIEIQVKTDRLNEIERTIISLNQLKIDVYNIRYSLKTDFALTKLALKEAAEKAREKAELLAVELNVKIEQAISVEELGVSNVATSNVNIRGGRSNEIGVYIDGFQQSSLLNGYTRTLFFEEYINRTASVRIVFSIKKQ